MRASRGHVGRLRASAPRTPWGGRVGDGPHTREPTPRATTALCACPPPRLGIVPGRETVESPTLACTLTPRVSALPLLELLLSLCACCRVRSKLCRRSLAPASRRQGQYCRCTSATRSSVSAVDALQCFPLGGGSFRREASNDGLRAQRHGVGPGHPRESPPFSSRRAPTTRWSCARTQQARVSSADGVTYGGVEAGAHQHKLGRE